MIVRDPRFCQRTCHPCVSGPLDARSQSEIGTPTGELPHDVRPGCPYIPGAGLYAGLRLGSPLPPSPGTPVWLLP
jgi:hypothetical protein